ncbi:MAG: twin-arginine translocation signal domain-containing protein, partial [Verrucomicrobia bacterium]|nr:twin-arginine translocation signal domain-containing protein [Verrucomicrobiota bacterium]
MTSVKKKIIKTMNNQINRREFLRNASLAVGALGAAGA